MKRIFTLSLLITATLLFFVSCGKKDRDVIVLEYEDSISLDPTISWAVITEPYAAFRKEASWSSSVNDHCRYGDVLMIEGTSIQDSSNEMSSKEIWYRFDRGWLSQSSLTVYQNKLKAQKASATLTK